MIDDLDPAVLDPTPVDKSSTARTEAFVQGLRDMADFIEAHPDFAPGWMTRGLDHHIFAATTTELTDLARQLLDDAHLGAVEKTGDDNYMNVVRHFGPHTLNACIARSIACTQVQVGTTAIVIPDPVKVKEIPTVTVDAPLYEWQCEPVLAKALDDEVPA